MENHAEWYGDKYIDRRSRTHDQMVQAAWSGVHNIASGSVASGISKKMELKLNKLAYGHNQRCRQFMPSIEFMSSILYPRDRGAALQDAASAEASTMNDNQQFLLYTTPDGAVRVEVYFKDETVWLTQKALAELFGVKRPSVTKHLSNIFATGELAENSVCSILEHTSGDGKTYAAKYYNRQKLFGTYAGCQRRS